MRFSARQLHCLEIMGIVPWVRAPAASHESRSEPVPASAPHSSGSKQLNLAELAHWLPVQSLVSFEYRGALTQCIGQPDAHVLVISHLDGVETCKAPLNTDESQLFDLMMRAIDLNRSHLRLCAVQDTSVSVPDDSNSQCVSDLCTSHTRAVIYLGSRLKDSTSSPSVHGVLTAPPLPFWQVTHPRQLLIDPQTKRAAWESLKAIKAALSQR